MEPTIYQGCLGTIDEVNKITPPDLDIDAYFPVENPDNYWDMLSTRVRRNGEVLTGHMHWTIHGTTESNGKQAFLLGDHNPMMLVISKDEEGIQHHADMQPKGGNSESFTPPWTSISNKAGFRQKRTMPYVLTEDDGTEIPAYLESQMTGYETIKTAAGIFQNCLRVDTYYQRQTGTIFTSAIHFFPGVGLVRYKFRQVNPELNSVICVGTLELEKAQVNGIAYGNA